MSQRAEDLATQFEVAYDNLQQAVEQASGPEWAATTAPEGWSVAAAAHHAAGSIGPLSTFVRNASTGEPLPPITPDQLDELNAQHAKDFHNVPKEEVIAEIQNNVPPAAALLRSLSDEQLDRQAQTPFGGAMTTQQIIENVLIGHAQQHLASMQTAK